MIREELSKIEPRQRLAALCCESPLWLGCQRQCFPNRSAIRPDGRPLRFDKPDKGPQRVVGMRPAGGGELRGDLVVLECGCQLPVSCLPSWEQAAAREYRQYIERMVEFHGLDDPWRKE